MKKILSIILTMIFVCGVFFCTPVSFAADRSIRFALTSDPHIDTQRSTLPVNYPESELYFHGGGSGNLYDEGPGLMKSFLNQIKGQDIDFVLISGDMTRSGTKEQHTFFANLLENFERETGIKSYVVPGNHDYFNCSPDEFKAYYKNVCYSNALVIDTETASYTADLPNGYRLIAVDSNDPGDDGDGMTQRLYNWIDEQVTAAHKDGRDIIYSMHHPVLEHLTLGKLLMKDFIVRDSDKVAEKFCEWGIQYTFTGHEHGNDISKHIGKNGNVLYDVLTTSLSSYPLEYRIVDFTEQGVTFTMQSIDECDFTSLIDGYNEKQLELMKSDYNEYAYELFKYSIKQKIFKYVSPEFIKGKLKLKDGNVLSNEIDALLNLVLYALDMPIYDSGDGGLSIEKLSEQKGVTLPKSEYESLADLVTSVVAMHYYGDENRAGSEYPECELFVKGLNTGLEFILSNADREAVKALIGSAGFDDLCGEYSQSLRRWIVAASNGEEDTYEIAGEIFYPLFNEFVVDKAPNDRNVTLPPIGETVNTQAKLMIFMQKIIKVLKYILNVVIAVIR